MRAWACMLCLVLFVLHISAGFNEGYAVDYDVYHDHKRYISELHGLASDPKNEGIARLHTSDIKTNEGLPQYYLQLTDFSVPEVNHHFQQLSNLLFVHSLQEYKLKMLLVFGEHPRELVTVESFFDLALNLTLGYHQPCHLASSRFARFILARLDLHLIGCLNQDGKRIMERRAQYCWRTNGRGVDLNRNADWEFGGPGSSGQRESEEYRGTAAFSEPETHLLRTLLERNVYEAFYSVHSGEQQIFVPFVDTKSKQLSRTRAQTPREIEV
jgi:hypothetical protein